MTKKEKIRKEKLMPLNVPKYVRVYDNNFEEKGTADNFTVVFSGRGYRVKGYNRSWHLVIAMGPKPYHSQGVCLHEEYDYVIDASQGWPVAIGRKCHLGKRIPFSSLPKDCQTVVLEDYIEYHNLK